MPSYVRRLSRRAVGALVVLAAVLSAEEADPAAPVTKEIISEQRTLRLWPAPRECGVTAVVRPDGATIYTPRQGQFIERCVTVTIVDSTGTVLSTHQRCDPLVFRSC